MIQKELHAQKIHYHVTITKSVGHAREAAKALSVQPEVCTIVVVGGDGTIHEVLSGLTITEHLVLGYIPTGSGNDFARGMHISTEPLQALHDILYETNTTLLDMTAVTIGKNQNRFGVSLGLGLDAAICHEVLSSRLKRLLNRIHLGKLIYFLIAFKQLLLYNPGTLSLELDGNRKFTYGNAWFAVVMNQSTEGGGLRLCPNARPNDGILDVCVVANVSRLKIALLLPTAFFGLHTHIRGVHIFRCKCISIHSNTSCPVHLDGESAGNRYSVSVFTENKTLKVITPVL